MKSYYEILGCSRKATTKELRLAFKKKALQLHPDVNPANRQKAERLFKEANTAFQVLSDDKKRREYDLEFFTQGEDEVDSDDVYYADEHYDREEEGYPRKSNNDPEDDEVIWNSDDPSHIEDADRNDRVYGSESGVRRQTSSSANRSPNQSSPYSGTSRSQSPNQPPRSGRSERGGARRRVQDAASWAARQSPEDDGTTPRPTVQSVMDDLLRRPVAAATPPPCNICHGSGRVSQARNYVITTLPCVCRTGR
jgi:curved DNA-binding protein CbpA